jgi:hypothetical protein
VRRTAVLAASVVALLAACSGGSSTGDRTADIYSAVIRAVLEDASHPLNVSSGTSVFVAPADARSPIPLEVQADIVEQLHQLATLRFVDERAEAIDDTSPTQTVDDGGVLVTLGRIPNGASVVTIRAERYLDATHTLVYRVTLKRVKTQWKPIATTAQT